MAEPRKKPTVRAPAAAAGPDDEIEALIRERQAVHLALFPGDPERALRLGHAYEEACARVVDFLLTLEAPERPPVIRSFQSDVASVMQRLSKPRKAPRLWSEREPDSPLNPAGFTRKYYARWLPGLTRKGSARTRPAALPRPFRVGTSAPRGPHRRTGDP